MYAESLKPSEKLRDFLDIKTYRDFSPDDIAMMLNSTFASMDTETKVKVKAMKYIDDILKKIAFLRQTQGKIHFYRIQLVKADKYDAKRILTFYSHSVNIMREVLIRMDIESTVWLKRP